MGMGFRLSLKWGFSVQSPFSTKSSSWPSSNYFKGKDANYDMASLSLSSAMLVESETLYSDPLRAPLRAHTCSSASQTLENDYSETKELKMTTGDDRLAFLTSLQANKASRFSLLLENIDMLERTFSDSDVVRLEREILVQIERLGALKLFHTFLSRTLKFPTPIDFYDMPSELIQEPRMDDLANDHMDKIVIRSGKKEERKSRRERASEKADKICIVDVSSKTNHKEGQHRNSSLARRPSNSRGRRLKITRNEAELSRGVKLVANLERLKMMLEEETGLVVSLSSWAAAAGVDKIILRENLHFGWCCRDALLRSTRSLVVYVARNYRGQGVAFEDLIQLHNFAGRKFWCFARCRKI